MKDGETRTYTVPLRKEYLKTPKWRRAEKAVSTLRSFVERHSKIEEIKIGRWVNESIWKRGAKNPPSRVRVDVKRVADSVTVELSELPRKAKTKEIPEKVEEKPKKDSKAKETKKVEEPKTKVKSELKKTTKKPVEKKKVAKKTK
jgi:large subunit ribosomal protein L31e